MRYRSNKIIIIIIITLNSRLNKVYVCMYGGVGGGGGKAHPYMGCIVCVAELMVNKGYFLKNNMIHILIRKAKATIRFNLKSGYT